MKKAAAEIKADKKIKKLNKKAKVICYPSHYKIQKVSDTQGIVDFKKQYGPKGEQNKKLITFKQTFEKKEHIKTCLRRFNDIWCAKNEKQREIILKKFKHLQLNTSGVKLLFKWRNEFRK